MNETKVTGVSLEELGATAEWKSLGPNLTRLLAHALQTRNLPGVIQEIYPNLEAELQRRIAEDLLKMPSVRQVINLYAVGIAVPLPVVTPDTEPVAHSADVPAIDCDTFLDAEQVN